MSCPEYRISADKLKIFFSKYCWWYTLFRSLHQVWSLVDILDKNLLTCHSWQMLHQGMGLVSQLRAFSLSPEVKVGWKYFALIQLRSLLWTSSACEHYICGTRWPLWCPPCSVTLAVPCPCTIPSPITGWRRLKAAVKDALAQGQ